MENRVFISEAYHRVYPFAVEDSIAITHRGRVYVVKAIDELGDEYHFAYSNLDLLKTFYINNKQSVLSISLYDTSCMYRIAYIDFKEMKLCIYRTIRDLHTFVQWYNALAEKHKGVYSGYNVSICTFDSSIPVEMNSLENVGNCKDIVSLYVYPKASCYYICDIYADDCGIYFETQYKIEGIVKEAYDIFEKKISGV